MRPNLQPLRLHPYREFLLILLVLAVLAWLGRNFGAPDWLDGGEGRYRLAESLPPVARYAEDMKLRVDLPPDARRAGWVAQICGTIRDYLPASDAAPCRPPPGLREKLRGKWRKLRRLPPENPPPHIPKPLDAEARQRLLALYPPLKTSHDALLLGWRARLEMPARLREAEQVAATIGPSEEWQEALRARQEETRLYRDAYDLQNRAGQWLPLPLECAWSYLRHRLENPATNGPATPAQALLGLAALLDGDRKKLPGAAFWEQGWDRDEERLGCAGPSADPTQPLEVAWQGAALVKQARASASNAAKADALRDGLPWVPAQFATWALTGLLVITLGRLPVRPARALGWALLIWAMVAALTRPHLQWLGGTELGFLKSAWLLPLALAVVGGLLLPWSRRFPGSMSPASEPASALGYPGFVLFLGLGWWLLLDLSAFGHFENRFQGLYQQSHVFAAFLVVSLTPILRAPLMGTGLRWLSRWPLYAAGPNRSALIRWIFILGVAVAVVSVFGLIGQGFRQKTSELFRLILIAGLSWFLLARADLIAAPWLWVPARAESLKARVWAGWLNLAYRLKLAAPLLPVGLVALGGLAVTDDLGPLLVIGYGAAMFAGAFAAWCWAGKATGWLAGFAAVGGWIWAVSYLLLRVGGALSDRVGERLESVRQPFLASNDQMALVLWFQEAAAEAGGFGLGSVPWCGDVPGVCRGVPKQIQSDYLFTALLGVFGPGLAWALVGGFAFWLWKLARAHPAITTGRPDAPDLGQAWLSWIAVCWVALTLVQLAVTVAGNLGWLPLTGITFPFLSYGLWSLLANAAFLGLALNLNRTRP